MATGWAKDGAVQEQIDASVDEAVKLARSQLAGGESLKECEDCAMAIPEARSPSSLGGASMRIVSGGRRRSATTSRLDQPTRE